MIALGGDKAWKVFRKGELVVAFHWVNKEPAMVLFPVRKRLGGSAFVIPLPVAHAYADRSGYPTVEAVARCIKAANVMAMGTDKYTVHNIMTAILDLMPELMAMPPEPVQKEVERAVGELKLIQGSKTVLDAGVNHDGNLIVGAPH